MIGYGIFLILVGVAGFASNPEKAKTALISGGVFGSLSVGWGILMARGFTWARWGALGMTLFLTLIFGWRTWASWAAVAAGEPKHVAAALITSMLVASLAILPFLFGKQSAS
ncbi:MAG: TMEM14 family protein [Terrimicrobiaceae bacterium]